jgi:hypothetical protein
MNSNEPNLGEPQSAKVTGQPTQSKVDLFSGDHTAGLIVAILFVIVLIGFVIYVSLKDDYNNLILNGFFSLLSLLGGFFAGSNINKNKQ